MENKEFAVIGCGRFGTSLALTLTEMGYEVLAIDKNEDVIDELSEHVTHAVVADVTQEHVLEDLGVANVDVAIIGTSSDFHASIVATIDCKELGVPRVIAKAQTKKHAMILEKIGADSVVIPEWDMGARLAHSLASGNIVEYLNLSDDYSLAEVNSPQCWENKTISELNVRAKYGVSIVAIVKDGVMDINPDPSDVLGEDDLLVILGDTKCVNRIEKLAR